MSKLTFSGEEPEAQEAEALYETINNRLSKIEVYAALPEEVQLEIDEVVFKLCSEIQRQRIHQGL